MGVEARIRIEGSLVAEVLGGGTLGTTQSGRLEDGTVIAAKRLEACAVMPPLEQLARLGPSAERALVPIHGIVSEGGHRWVVSELAAGVSLKILLERGRMAPMCAVAVAMGLLDAVAALHQVGLRHGSIHPGNVHIGPDGSVRLSDYCLAPRDGQTDARLWAADIQAVGILLCAMLRLPVDGDGGRQNQRTSKVAQSPLGLLARRMARAPRKRRSAYTAIDDRLALWEAAGRLGTRRMQAAAKARLAEMVAGPAAGDSPVPQPAPAEQTPREPGVVRRRRIAGFAASVLLAAIVASLVAISPLALLRSAAGSRPVGGPVAAATAIRPPSETTAPTNVSSAVPHAQRALPALAPTAAGQVSSVRARLIDPVCSAGAACLLQVQVWVQPSARPRLVAWTVKSIPLCDGPVLDVGTGAFTAQPGWTHIASDNRIALPQLKAQALVVVSTMPDLAASAPLFIGDAGAPCR
jgi:hypothetical protein